MESLQEMSAELARLPEAVERAVRGGISGRALQRRRSVHEGMIARVLPQEEVPARQLLLPQEKLK
eukprot:CAMPEP_0175783188 /NCGR_PEP_ID=MMETSP0097-20121207/78175_1 /TAXON_ID=311494 /ORGANISM="Alexandrium monilatum, Strain CCMP3105" /LENGTH=64 /DNA_ID=CAMNT_0017094043 /DNA_START=24 /DNA_END=218 /DNA_ORIENTATION=+